MTHVPKQVKDISTIALDQHAVIEASAGTGKTYCIENLVVRLLCEKEIPLEKILLVTFTEKATGDLQARIRSNIIKAMNDGVGSRRFLLQALESFDTAAIYTIHGFCQRMLRQYAFENGGNFQMEMVADGQLYPSLLRIQQRDEWPAEYGENLGLFLQLSGYPGTVDKDGESSWEKRVLELATRYSPFAGDHLEPSPGATGSLSDVDQLVAAAATAAVDFCGWDDLMGEEPSLIAAFQQLPMHASTAAACINRVLRPLIDFLAVHRESPATVVGFKELLDQCNDYRRFSEDGFACLVNGVYDNKVTDDTQPVVERFSVLARLMDDTITQTGVNGIKEWLASRTVARLVEMAADYKLDQGLMSFDDMLRMMDSALNPEKNPRAGQMMKQMRKRFQYALVDEFQDTDPVQWDIFRRIFLGSPDQRLFLIGDPKQAIYSFRGADVYTYIQAREEMLQTHNANCYNLPVNWRSSEGLVNALNQLCGSDAWFTTKADTTRIPFQPVEVPPIEKRRHQLFVDRSHRAPVSIIDLYRPDRAAGIARKWMAKFIAEEIERLIGGNDIIYGSGDTRHQLNVGDICVLVSRRSEAAPLEELFISKGIPYTFYKQGGLYESQEANHLYFLFKAIADPGDSAAVRAALLSAAFQLQPADLNALPDIPPDHPARILINQWHELAMRRDWPELFRSVLEESQLVAAEAGALHGERRMCNYRHILQDLHVAAEAGNLDFENVLEIVRDYQDHYTLLPDNADQQRQASEEPKVQIMTIHSSKGLEFPVVFLAGGFTAMPESDYFEFHNDDGCRVYDLIKSTENRDAWATERTEEELRLFYVALTRAIFKLYIPRFRPDRMGYAGPVSHFLFSSIEDAFNGSDTPDVRHLDVNGNDLYSSQRLPDYVFEDAGAAQPNEESKLVLPEALSIDLPEFTQRMRVVGSFSALNTHSGSKAETSLLDLAKQFEDEVSETDETFTWMDELDETVKGDELPPGADTGSMLHEIFETIDFNHVRNASESAELIRPGASTRTSIENALETYPITTTLAPEIQYQLIADMVYNTLTCPLFDDEFVLAELNDHDRLHEMEFMFPVLQGLDVPETRYRDGYLVGFIDLIFRYNGKYYILDWKSNKLKDGYGNDELEMCMDEAGYRLQYKVYSIALCRWLATAIPDFSPDEHFGGVFYLFLRGTQPGNRESGIFRYVPEAASQFVEWRQELASFFKV